MTYCAKNGSGDAWYYGRWEDEGTFERYITLCDFDDGGRYGSGGGWMATNADKVIDDNTTLITNAMLDAIEASGDVAGELEKLEDMEGNVFFDDVDEELDDE